MSPGRPPAGLAVLPVTGIGEVRPGDDLATLITDAAPWLADGDVLVVTSKIVSKAEGRLVPVPTEEPARQAARDAVLAAQTTRTVASRGTTRIVQTHHGFVMASAGIDASNVDSGHLVLLPVDPDASARALRSALRDRYGLDVAVVVSDTMGRPWRVGLTDVALGAAGIAALRDYRGQADAHGNELHITQMAVVDELAGAAELVKGKYDQVPVAVVRGLPAGGAPAGEGARVLVRDAEHDLFPLGTAEARAAGMRAAAAPAAAHRLADVPVDVSLVRQALDLVGSPTLRLLGGARRDAVLHAHPDLTPAAVLVAATVPASAGRGDVATAGGDLARLAAALLAAGLVSRWLPGPPDAAGTPPEVALLAAGHPAP